MKYFIWALAFLLVIACASKEEKGSETSEAKTKQESMKDGSKSSEKKDAKPEEKAAAAPSDGDVVCKSGSDVRTISNKKLDGGGCQVIYNKGGQDNPVANAKADIAFCNKVAGRIQKNLETAGFSCE